MLKTRKKIKSFYKLLRQWRQRSWKVAPAESIAIPVSHKSDKKPDGSPVVLHCSGATTGLIFRQVGHG